jgi:hypothetical protein
VYCFPANKEKSFKEGNEETITILVEETPCHDPGTEEYSLAKCDNALCDSDPGGDAVHTTSKVATGMLCLISVFQVHLKRGAT